jgi:hypothetical protein
VDSTTDANNVLFTYSNASFYDVKFNSGNSIIYVNSTKKLLPKATLSGSNIPSNTFIEHIVDGNHVQLSAAATDNSTGTYTFRNPAHAKITVQKVDFSDVIFASTSEREAPNSFFTYTRLMTNVNGSFTNGNSTVSMTDTSVFSSGQLIRVIKDEEDFNTSVISIANSTHLVMNTPSTFTGTGTIYYGNYLYYNDDANYLVGRSGGANVVVLTHARLDTNATPAALLSNSHLTDEELVYWKPVNAYDYELYKNDVRKEIFVLDSSAINQLDDNLEALLKNV